MPVYEVLTTQGTLDASQRERLAEEITKVHTEETGAPAAFVQVVFPELPPAGYSYTAGKAATPHIIRGQVRAGRPTFVRHAIIKRLFTFYSELTGANPMSILVAVMDVPAQWVMEAGQILPEPTPEAEQAWFEALDPAGATPPRPRASPSEREANPASTELSFHTQAANWEGFE